MSLVTRMNESCHTCEGAVSSVVNIMGWADGAYGQVTYERVLSQI